MARNPDPTLVIGVDFGTTFSGFTFAMWRENLQLTQGHTGKAEIFTVLEWDDQRYPYAKTPTVALYEGAQMKQWGWPAEVHRSQFPQAHFMQRVKLHLQPKNVISDFDAHRSAPLPPGVAAAKVITDYLIALKEFIFKAIDKRGVLVNAKTIRWCLTVPAIWNDYAKDVMTSAAEAAGMVQGPHCPPGQGSSYELEIVPEPEAALLWSLQSLRENTGVAVNFDVAYLILDLGGGTADLVMHGFRQGTNKVVELTKGTGDLCGASLLDELFFRQVLPKLIPAWADISADYPVDAHRLRGTWDKIKRAFNGRKLHGDGDLSFDFKINLDMPGRLCRFVDARAFPNVHEEESVQIDAREIKFLFDYVLGKVTYLIDGQVQALRSAFETGFATKPITMFVVGGFSESGYIQHELKRKYSSSMTVFTPPNPGAAICNGAVVYGLNPSIFAARRARRTYGAETLALARSTDPYERIIVVNGREMIKKITPFVYKGQLIEADTWVSQAFEPANPSDTTINVALYAFENDGVRYPNDPGVIAIGQLHINIPDGLEDKTIMIEMNFSGPVLKVVGYSRASKEKKPAPVTINLNQ